MGLWVRLSLVEFRVEGRFSDIFIRLILSDEFFAVWFLLYILLYSGRSILSIKWVWICQSRGHSFSLKSEEQEVTGRQETHPSLPLLSEQTWWTDESNQTGPAPCSRSFSSNKSRNGFIHSKEASFPWIMLNLHRDERVNNSCWQRKTTQAFLLIENDSFLSCSWLLFLKTRAKRCFFAE